MADSRESYRKAGFLLAQAVRDHQYHSVLFSGAKRGEGVTTTVLHLARRLRDEHELKPLVIELDFRHPALCRLFGLDQRRSLAALAGNEISCIQECIQEDPSGLHLLPAGEAGHAKPDLAALLGRVLKDVEGRYDVILLDAPPVLEGSDTLAACGVVPRVFLVVKAGHTPREVLARIKRELEASNIALVGAFLNRRRYFIPGWIYRLVQ